MVFPPGAEIARPSVFGFEDFVALRSQRQPHNLPGDSIVFYHQYRHGCFFSYGNSRWDCFHAYKSAEPRLP